MKKILTLCLISVFGSAGAQIIITSADMPVVNDTLRYSTTSASVNVNQTGADYIWDFSKLIVEHQEIQHHYSPLQTPYILQFGFTATYGIAENNFALGAMGGVASDVFGFYKNSAAASVMIGRGATIQSLPLGITYAPRDTIFKFPLSYLKSYSGSFSGEASLLGLGSLKQTGTRTTNVDGWGSITTPFGVFQCIRVKSVIVETDSVVFNGFGFPVPNNRTEYKWLAKNQHFPILEVIVNDLTSVQTVRYRDRYRPEAYINNANFTASKTIAQRSDTVNLNNQSYGTPTNFNWTITPGTFRFVGGTNTASASPRIMFDNVGTYSVKLKVNYEGGMDDTLKTNYIMVAEAPKALFGASTQFSKRNEIVYMIDSSLGAPTSWTWTITPTTFEYVAGTSNRSKNPLIVFSAFGNYNVQLQIIGPLGSSTLLKPDFILVWPTGLQNSSQNNVWVKVYPNPGNQFLKIEFQDHAPASIQLHNLLGQLVMSCESGNSPEKELDITLVPKGIYIIKIVQNNQIFTDRLLID
ncbi:MAG: T9SS type A sorting domain-containing protein [Bacteroidota bacterium]|nr:T9SS type A sorting domain-containing protein [Bacteroidota bacterium]